MVEVRTAGSRLCCLLAGFALVAGTARAAGGHHWVDDASMIEPGLCEFESWVEREPGAARTLLHAALGCRAGPVELGIGTDHQRSRAASAANSFNPQLKWTTQLTPTWSAGVVVSGVWLAGSDRGYRGGTLLVPITWQAPGDLLLHLNAGRDFRRHEADTVRAGIALEWTPSGPWSVVAERYREGGGNFWRLGGRWSPTPAVSIDVSRAAGMNAAAAPGRRWA